MVTIIDTIRRKLDALLPHGDDDLRVRWAHGTLDGPLDTDGTYVGFPPEVISGMRWNRAGFGTRIPDDSVVLTVYLGDRLIYDAGEWMPSVLGGRCAVIDRDEVELLLAEIYFGGRLHNPNDVDALMNRLADAVGLNLPCAPNGDDPDEDPAPGE